MKIRKTAAAVLAAVLAASAPLAGAVNNALSVTASAAETEVKTEGDWEYEVNEDGETVCITFHFGTKEEVVIPATLGGKKVTTIGARAFFSDHYLTKVTIPYGVTTIGQGAFMDCWDLTNVTIPDSVTTIDQSAFSDTALKSVTIPNGVATIGYGAFSRCPLTSVTIPGSVTTIGDYAFAGCPLTSVTISDGVTTIGSSAFDSCCSLTSVTIPRSVMSIGMYTFDWSPVETVYYGGKKAEWEAIKIPEIDDVIGNDNLDILCLLNAKIIYTDGIVGEPETSQPTTSEPATSEPTSIPTTSTTTESTVTPGDSDKQEILDVTLKSLDSENGLEGEKLDAALFGDSGRTWEQVEKIEFLSADLFSVQYKNDSGDWVKLGDEEAARAGEVGIWNTAWTLSASEMGKDKYAKVIAKDGTINVTAKVYIKKDAEKPASGEDQKPTGITLAVAPAVLAAGAAIVLFKKRK